MSDPVDRMDQPGPRGSKPSDPIPLTGETGEPELITSPDLKAAACTHEEEDA